MARSVTTTSHAILGLLAVRDWTSYELARQMRHSLRAFWPRAESKLYEEPKKLVALGLATATLEQVGRRARTVYGITEEGRQALRGWLARDAPAPLLESEPVLRVFLAPNGTREDLLRTLRGTLAWAEQEQAQHRAVARAYRHSSAAFPGRAAVNTLVGAFLSDFVLMTAGWARWALAEVEGWPDDLADAPVPVPALDLLAEGSPVAPAASTGRGVGAEP